MDSRLSLRERTLSWPVRSTLGGVLTYYHTLDANYLPSASREIPVKHASEMGTWAGEFDDRRVSGWAGIAGVRTARTSP